MLLGVLYTKAIQLDTAQLLTTPARAHALPALRLELLFICRRGQQR